MKKILVATALIASTISSLSAAVVFECVDNSSKPFVIVLKKDKSTLMVPSTIGLNDWSKGRGKTLYNIQPDMDGSYSLYKHSKGISFVNPYNESEGQCKLVK